MNEWIYYDSKHSQISTCTQYFFLSEKQKLTFDNLFISTDYEFAFGVWIDYWWPCEEVSFGNREIGDDVIAIALSHVDSTESDLTTHHICISQ